MVSQRFPPRITAAHLSRRHGRGVGLTGSRSVRTIATTMISLLRPDGYDGDGGCYIGQQRVAQPSGGASDGPGLQLAACTRWAAGKPPARSMIVSRAHRREDSGGFESQTAW